MILWMMLHSVVHKHLAVAVQVFRAKQSTNGHVLSLATLVVIGLVSVVTLVTTGLVRVITLVVIGLVRVRTLVVTLVVRAFTLVVSFVVKWCTGVVRGAVSLLAVFRVPLRR